MKLSGIPSLFLFALCVLPASAVSAGAAEVRPNIVFILADDLGWRDLGCYGSTFDQTPNVDALATRGVRFTQAYAANPLCSPTRSSILTGLWPARTGITAPVCHLPRLVLEKRLIANAPPTRKVLVADSVTRLKTDYGAMVESLDDGVGRVLSALEECGIADRTIVVYFSDNGGVSWPGKDGKPHKSERFQADMKSPPTSNLPLRNGKASCYEGGVREPCIVVWPGVTKLGTVNDAVIQSIDWMPTLLEMVGVPMPKGVKVDGLSLVPLLRGGKLDRDAIFCHFPHDTPASG